MVRNGFKIAGQQIFLYFKIMSLFLNGFLNFKIYF